MLHNKSLKIFYSLHHTISMADFLSFQVFVDLRFFFVQNLFFCVCVTKIGVERLLKFHLFVLAIAIFLIFNLPDSYFAWARDDASIPSKLVPSRRSKFAGVSFW